MDMDQSELFECLSSIEIDALINLYYNQDESKEKVYNSSIDKETLASLFDKKLIITKPGEEKNFINLTQEGLNFCGIVMKYQIDSKEELFKEKIQSIPERAVATLVKRVIWKDETQKESGIVDPITKPYALDEKLWYERVLLKDKKIQKILERFYNILEEVDFLKNIKGQRWCSYEVEEYLENKYRNMMDLTWQEEDSLKYYYFFYIYAQDQRNLINFSGIDEEYKSMFFDEKNPPDYWFSSNRNDPHQLLSSLGISNKRTIGFLEEMKAKDIVIERIYPLSSFSFFSGNEKIFVIKDIEAFIDYIRRNFLTPVVNSLIK